MMSRREFQDPEGVSWTVGWDEPMVTYFAQREDADHELEDLAGTTIGDVTTLDGLLERLQGHVELPDDIRAALAREAPAFTEPKVIKAQAHHDQLGAYLRDGMGPPAPGRSGPEVGR